MDTGESELDEQLSTANFKANPRPAGDRAATCPTINNTPEFSAVGNHFFSIGDSTVINFLARLQTLKLSTTPS